MKYKYACLVANAICGLAAAATVGLGGTGITTTSTIVCAPIDIVVVVAISIVTGEQATPDAVAFPSTRLF